MMNMVGILISLITDTINLIPKLARVILILARVTSIQITTEPIIRVTINATSIKTSLISRTVTPSQTTRTLTIQPTQMHTEAKIKATEEISETHKMTTTINITILTIIKKTNPKTRTATTTTMAIRAITDLTATIPYRTPIVLSRAL